jgi:hypothetical protein
MKNLILLFFAVLIFAFNACQKQCVRVTGPNDVSYATVSPPDCTTGTFTVNSIADFDIYCPGGTTPASWDFTNKTYFIINGYFGGTTPYLAGVGNDPSDGSTIIVTLGHPCANGPIPAIPVHEIFGIEVAKTAKSFVVVQKDEQEK